MGTTTEQQRRRRLRNVGEDGKQLTRSGSSGASGSASNLVHRIERRSYEDIESDAVDGPEFAGQVVDVRVLANRTVSLSIIIPAVYAHEVVDLGFDSASMYTFFRSSHVPRRSMLPAPEDEPDTEGVS